MRPHSKILVGDVIEQLRTLPDASVHCCVTSPPYWGLRDYGVDGQIGLEKTPEEFVGKMVAVFSEVRRVLRDDGTLWLNLGDSYFSDTKGSGGPSLKQDSNAGSRYEIKRFERNGLKPKDLIGIPWRVAFALQADGWYLRQDIIWSKPNPMPESVTDRCTKAHEYIFLLAKSQRYVYDAAAIAESAHSIKGSSNKERKPASARGVPVTTTGSTNGGVAGSVPWEAVGTRNKRSVWHIATQPYPEAHFATFPTEIPRRAIMAGTSEKGCCPECGAPWLRITSKEKVTRERPNDFTKRNGEEGTGNSCANSVAGVSVSTIVWEPTCNHEAEPIPCTVLEPFLGSGTTLQVARSLGRSGIGIELNPAYVELAERRIKRPCKWEPGYDDPSPVKACAGQRSLFGESH